MKCEDFFPKLSFETAFKYVFTPQELKNMTSCCEEAVSRPLGLKPPVSPLRWPPKVHRRDERSWGDAVDCCVKDT